jgi:hypothetical protein
MAMALVSCSVRAEPAPPAPRVGDTSVITMIRDSVEQTDGESSGSSHDEDAIREKVIAIRADGVELEYDLPAGARAEERAQVWQMPARVFRPDRGPLQLLNRAELATRLEALLKKAKWMRALCGHWIFTWNAFRIECDPQSVLDIIGAFDLRADLREGAPYQDENARAPAPFARTRNGPGGATFVVEMEIDPEKVRRERAESDVAVGGILNHPVTLEAAVREHAKERISGTISVAFETDGARNVVRRTRVAKVTVQPASGARESSTVTETVERHFAGRGARP